MGLCVVRVCVYGKGVFIVRWGCVHKVFVLRVRRVHVCFEGVSVCG